MLQEIAFMFLSQLLTTLSPLARLILPMGQRLGQLLLPD